MAGHLPEQQGASEAEGLGGPAELRVRRARQREEQAAAQPSEAVHVSQGGETVVDLSRGQAQGTERASTDRAI